MILASVYHTILAIFFAVLAILLMIVILLQRGRGVGLAGAFGGAGGASAFGAKTGDVLTWVTVVGAGLLLLFTVFLNYVYVQGDPGLEQTPSISAPAGTPPAGAGEVPPTGAVPIAPSGSTTLPPPAPSGAGATPPAAPPSGAGPTPPAAPPSTPPAPAAE